ncbi:dephospho-CoA kinase [Niallia taxi]|uniref:dephospho-CoA kinase n=1 Tax=Niallia taxi TaxID=2499688 RepID=UPI0021A36197|nr:dephospho-CoA kinase [Niallia taxi]MCT2343044.1 dephospho-CoA kinase [Niallia taxi]WOD64086.1 dephospho-CoA kinase [Niallia taxi]
MTLIIGLTGGIASGKSTISNYLRSLSLPIIDADVEARLAVEKGEPGYSKIVEHFGTEILLEDGSLNRAKLGEIVFRDEKQRAVLNGIVHPEVRNRMNQKQNEAIAEGHMAVILDIPLLFENKLDSTVDKTILVYVDTETQISRLMDRNKLSLEQAKLRIEAQMPLQEKKALADKIIDNNGTVENSQDQALKILQDWKVL